LETMLVREVTGSIPGENGLLLGALWSGLVFRLVILLLVVCTMPAVTAIQLFGDTKSNPDSSSISLFRARSHFLSRVLSLLLFSSLSCSLALFCARGFSLALSLVLYLSRALAQSLSPSHARTLASALALSGHPASSSEAVTGNRRPQTLNPEPKTGTALGWSRRRTSGRSRNTH